MDKNIIKLDNDTDFANAETKIIDIFTNGKSITDDKTIVGIINTDIMPDIRDYKKPDFEALKKIQLEGLYKKQPVSEAQNHMQQQPSINQQKTNTPQNQTIIIHTQNVVVQNQNKKSFFKNITSKMRNLVSKIKTKIDEK